MKWHKWARSRHLDEVAREHLPDGIYLETRTIDTGTTIGYAALTKVSPTVESSVEQRYKYIEHGAHAQVAAGDTLTVDKLVAVYTSRDVAAASVRPACLDELRRHTATGFEGCRERNRAAWQAKWADSDVTIDGDPDTTRAARFNIYQLLIAANESDPRVNIGANALSGERYRGHAFWDTEVFMLPFFIYTQPETARALLLYRYHTLDGARQNARDGGFRGARYAWESADTGVETTPKWTWDGAHRIWMGEEEIHVTAAVAYGLIAYVAATGDHALMTDYGAEILFETSRFWASRLEAMPDGRYALSRVVGPDEFHEHIDNSAPGSPLKRSCAGQRPAARVGAAGPNPGLTCGFCSVGRRSTPVKWRARTALTPTTWCGGTCSRPLTSTPVSRSATPVIGEHRPAAHLVVFVLVIQRPPAVASSKLHTCTGLPRSSRQLSDSPMVRISHGSHEQLRACVPVARGSFAGRRRTTSIFASGPWHCCSDHIRNFGHTEAGLATLVLRNQQFRVPEGLQLLAGSAALFAVAAIFGLLTNWTRPYRRPHYESLSVAIKEPTTNMEVRKDN